MEQEKNKGGRPRVYKDEKEFLAAYMDYLDYCNTNDRVATVEGFCVYGGIAPDTFYSYTERFPQSKKWIDQATLDQAINSKKPPGLIVFYLKNRFGWQDTPEVVIDNRSINLLGMDSNNEEIEKLFSKLGYLPNPER